MANYTNTPCPKCGSKVFNNRIGKTNPKSPDEKCSNKAGCDYAMWDTPRNGRAPAPTAATPYRETGAPPSPTAGYAGPILPGETLPQAAPASDVDRLDRMFYVYTLCWNTAILLAKRDLGQTLTHEGVAAQTANLYIAAANKGLV